LHQAGGGHVGLVEHGARRKAHEARAPVGLHHDDACNAQLGITEQQLVAHRQPQRFQQGGIHPHVARRRNIPRGLRHGIGRIGHLQAAAQGIARLHALEGHKLGGTALHIAGPAHGGKAHGRHGLQAERPRALGKGGGRGVVTGHHGITAQQLQGVTLKPSLQTVRKKTHRRQCRDRKGDSHHEQAQLTRTQVTDQGAQPQAKKGQIHGCEP